MQVLVIRVVAAEDRQPLRDADVQVCATDAVERRIHTDYTGRATFTVTGGSAVDVEAKAVGRVRVRREGVLPPAPDAPVEIALERGVIVQGTVRSEEGDILREASVTAFLTEPYLAALPYDADPRPVETTTTGARGAYRLDCIPRGVACVLVVESAGGVAARYALEPQPDPDYVVRLDATVEAGVPLEGTVLNAAREPVEGAWVFADRETRLGLRWLWRNMSRDDMSEVDLLMQVDDARRDVEMPRFRARTGPDGAFRLTVPQRWERVRALAMHASAGRSACAHVADPARERTTLVLRGRVRAVFEVTTPDRKPAVGAVIQPYFAWERWTAPPMKPGLYGPADMDDGAVVVRAAGAVEAPGVYGGRRIAADTIRWRVLLERGATWSGQVRDDRESPVPGATVTAGERVSVTDEDGKFELRGVHPEVDWIEARAPGHAPDGEEVSHGEARSIQLTLPRAAAVRATLRLPAAAAVPTWRRVWTGTDGWGEVPWTDEFAWREGSVGFEEWDPGEEVLAVFVPGYEVVVLNVQVAPGGAADLGEIRLFPATHVRGVVVDEAENPVAGAEVALRVRGKAPWREMIPERTVDTDARGEFEIEVNAPEHPSELLVLADGFLPLPQAVDGPPGVAQKVVLRAPRLFRGRLARELGKWLRARLEGPAGEVYAQVPVRADGTFEAEVPLVPRTVVVVSWSPWYEKDVQRATVPDGLAEGEVFVLPR